MSPVDHHSILDAMSSSNSAAAFPTGKLCLLSGQETYHSWSRTTTLLLESKQVSAHAEGTRKRPVLLASDPQPTTYSERQHYEDRLSKWDDDDALARSLLLMTLSPNIVSIYKVKQLRDAQARIAASNPLFGREIHPAVLRGTSLDLLSYL